MDAQSPPQKPPIATVQIGTQFGIKHFDQAVLGLKDSLNLSKQFIQLSKDNIDTIADEQEKTETVLTEVLDNQHKVLAHLTALKENLETNKAIAERQQKKIERLEKLYDSEQAKIQTPTRESLDNLQSLIDRTDKLLETPPQPAQSGAFTFPVVNTLQTPIPVKEPGAILTRKISTRDEHENAKKRSEQEVKDLKQEITFIKRTGFVTASLVLLYWLWTYVHKA